MTTVVDFNSGAVTQQAPLIQSESPALPPFQAQADTASDIGERILNNSPVECLDRGTVIKAVLIVGGGLAVAGAYFVGRALLPDTSIYPYVFVAALIMGGCMFCAPYSPYEHQSRMARL